MCIYDFISFVTVRFVDWIGISEARYIQGDPLKGYYDFIITEGSYKFWAAFQVNWHSWDILIWLIIYIFFVTIIMLICQLFIRFVRVYIVLHLSHNANCLPFCYFSSHTPTNTFTQFSILVRNSTSFSLIEKLQRWWRCRQRQCKKFFFLPNKSLIGLFSLFLFFSSFFLLISLYWIAFYGRFDDLFDICRNLLLKSESSC